MLKVLFLRVDRVGGIEGCSLRSIGQGFVVEREGSRLGRTVFNGLTHRAFRSQPLSFLLATQRGYTAP